MPSQPVIPVLRRNSHGFHPVVPFNAAGDCLLAIDFTENNTTLSEAVFSDTEQFSAYINAKLAASACRYGIGGYGELRTIYARSDHFNGDGEPRRLHLGVDIWGPAGTPVFAFMGGMVHSFAYNSGYGDYGATLVLLHQLDGISFYTLYGHIRLKDIEGLSAGGYVVRGQQVAGFGLLAENGQWPPHLHFQLICDMQGMQGDYPGVCKYSERAQYLRNCPDPDLVLQLGRYCEK